jgi:hypothetical protein
MPTKAFDVVAVNVTVCSILLQATITEDRTNTQDLARSFARRSYYVPALNNETVLNEQGLEKP